MEVLSDTFIPPGVRDVSGVFQRCPRCVWPYLQPVNSLDQAHWLCTSCGHCWHLERGRLRAVDPITCHGCAARSKHECITLLQHEFPRFAAGAATDDEVLHT